MQREFEYLQDKFPDMSQEQLIKQYSLFNNRSRSTELTDAQYGKALMDASKNIRAAFELDYLAGYESENKLRASQGEENISKEKYIAKIAKEQVDDAYNIKNTAAPSVPSGWGKAEKVKGT